VGWWWKNLHDKKLVTLKLFNMNVYLFENGSVSRSDGSVAYFDKEVFSSKLKLEQRISNAITVNKGTNIKRETMGGSDYVNYNCISTDGRTMTVVYRTSKLRLK
jgi:hypothetical protein